MQRTFSHIEIFGECDNECNVTVRVTVNVMSIAKVMTK